MSFERLLILQNADFEGPGAVLAWAHARGIATRVLHAYAGETYTLAPDEGVVALGSPTGDGEAWAESELEFLKRAAQSGRHVLGICFGAQLLARAFGAENRFGPHREIGWHPVAFDFTATPLRALGKTTTSVFQWHRGIFDLPENATSIGRSPATPHQAFFYPPRTVALAGHAEIDPALVVTFIERCGLERTADEPYVQAEAEILRETPARSGPSASFFTTVFDAWRAL